MVDSRGGRDLCVCGGGEGNSPLIITVWGGRGHNVEYWMRPTPWDSPEM